jgi:hypothetical protein
MIGDILASETNSTDESKRSLSARETSAARFPSGAGMALLNGLLLIPLMVAKVFTEMVLFLASYLAQKRLIFVQRVVRSVGEKSQTRLDA